MPNPYADAQHRHGQKSEARVAKSLGARPTIASGSVGAKGDMMSGDWLIENKATIHKSASIRWDWLEKITREAHTTGKNPVLILNFVDGDGNPIPFGSWALVPIEALREILDGETS